MQPTRKRQANETKRVRFEEAAQERPKTTARPKPRELYKQELKEVLAKLLEKYYDFIELFVKKEYRLPNHGKEYKARILLKLGFIPPSVKQQYKSRDQLELENKFVREFLAVVYICEG